MGPVLYMVPYDINVAIGKQRLIILQMMETVMNYVTWKQTGFIGSYYPMRMTVSGEGGTGKSFIIQCIVSHISK